MSTVTTISGHAVFPDSVKPAEIVVDCRSGLISEIREPQAPVPEEVLILPGLVDMHVHAREYARPVDAEPEQLSAWQAAVRKESFLTAGQAAINGGVTLYGAMPNDPDPPDTPEKYDRKQRLAEASPCPVVVFAVVTRDSEPWADLPYKVYMDTRPSRVSFDDWREMETALSRHSGCRVFFHAEDPVVLKTQSGNGPRWITRPSQCEISGVERVLDLTARFALRTHICHVSTQQAVELISDYNRSCSGQKVTCEVTPHHLFFHVEDGEVRSADSQPVLAGELLESNPPLRSRQDAEFLTEALRNGLVDALASDHAPHTLEDKKSGAPGMPHLDTMAGFVGWLIKTRGFAPSRIAEIAARIPARLLDPERARNRGIIEPGAEGTLTIVDTQSRTSVRGNSIQGRGPLRTRCGWSPFEGMDLPARTSGVIIRGQLYTS